MKRTARDPSSPPTPEIGDLLFYSFMWKEFGLSREEADAIDPKAISEYLLYRKVKNEVESEAINKG